MLKLCFLSAFLSGLSVCIAGAPSLEKEFYEQYVDDQVHFVSNKTYDLLRSSKAALVTSGRNIGNSIAECSGGCIATVEARFLMK